MMSMIGHALMGLVIGLVARAVLPGKQHMGLILTMLLGMGLVALSMVVCTKKANLQVL